MTLQLGGVNTSGKYVWAMTNHFSTWGLFGSPVVSAAPSSASSASSGGGGGGGGGGCFSDWICSNWSSCVNGFQNRTCKLKASYCSPNKKPAEQQKCGESANKSNENLGFSPLNNINDTSTKTGISRITGAVIGAFKDPGILIPAIFIIAVIVIAIIITYARKSENASEAGEEAKTNGKNNKNGKVKKAEE